MCSSDLPGSLNGDAMTVEIDLIGNGIDTAVERTLSGMTAPRERLIVRRNDYNARIDEVELGAMAAAVAAQIKRRRNELGVEVVRLFVAAPVPFAALLGSEMNVLGADIELHEYDGRKYEPSLRIDAR